MNSVPINEHEGSKYVRKIVGVTKLNEGVEIDGEIYPVIEIDVYKVIIAFGITCPCQQHALKKLLAAGLRGKGRRVDDLQGVIAATNRAIEEDKIQKFKGD